MIQYQQKQTHLQQYGFRLRVTMEQTYNTSFDYMQALYQSLSPKYAIVFLQFMRFSYMHLFPSQASINDRVLIVFAMVKKV